MSKKQNLDELEFHEWCKIIMCLADRIELATKGMNLMKNSFNPVERERAEIWQMAVDELNEVKRKVYQRIV